MNIRMILTFDSYIVLRNILDDCRVRRLTTYDYSRLMDITMILEEQATRRMRVADVVTLTVKTSDYVCLRECIMAVERHGLSTRTDPEVQTLITELNWSCGVGDALIKHFELSSNK